MDCLILAFIIIAALVVCWPTKGWDGRGIVWKDNGHG
jgi:hypothetical protein